MKTAQWAKYSGSGRVAISPAPRDARKGYRLSPVLYFDKPEAISSGMIDLAFKMADPLAVWRQLAVLTYPYEPVLMGVADPEVDSYRRQFARWLAFYTGETISEILDPEHRAVKQRRPVLYGLTGPALKSAPIV